MTPLRSGLFRELFLVSAAVQSMLGLVTSSIKQSEVQTTEKETERSATIENIGIKLCQVRCVETGGCLRYEYSYETLTCRLRLGESKPIEKNEGFIVLQKNHSDVPAGPCTDMSCSLGSRCIESRSGKAVCVRDREKFYPSRSQQQKRDQKRKSGDSILHEACREGDLSRLQLILTEGHVDLNSREKEHGRTPLMLAARWGHRDVFDLVVSKGGDASLVDTNGDNILHLASLGGHVDMVKYILSQNIVDINSRGVYGRTPLLFTAIKSHRDVFDLIMSKGGDASLVDTHGDNILHLACLGGHVEMVKYILSQNIVDINSRGEVGKTPLLLAATVGQRGVFDLVMSKGGDASLVDTKGDNILHLACLGGHVEMVKYILSQNIVDINSRGEVGKTPLLLAATGGQRGVFDLVMSKGGNASLVDTKSDNILHLSCLGGHVDMVKYILSQNIVDINSRGAYGRTPLMFAAIKGYKDVFHLVISKGGDASLVATNGDTILHFACSGGQVEMVKYILSQNIVDINSRGGYGRTPLMLAGHWGHRDVFDLVMSKGGNASLVDTYGDNILHSTCSGGHVEMVKYILSQNIVDINSRGAYGRTPLMFAAIKGYKDVFDLVMSKGGNASLVDTHGDNILHLACLGGHVEMVKYILSQNIVDINSRGQYGRTPLMFAAAGGHRDMFDLVMSKGGDVSAVDGNGDNILHLACHRGHVKMVKCILSQNIVDINSRGAYGRTPLMFAATVGHRNMFDLVMSKGGDVSAVDGNGDNILHLACLEGHAEMVKCILSQNIVDINSRGAYGRTPLMVAATGGHRDVFDLVMSKGGDVSAVDGNGDNILHLACLGGHLEMVKYILSQNIVDINSRGAYGRTPLMFAATWGHRDVFDLVMSKGGDVSAVDGNGGTILHLACFRGQVEIVKHILSQDIVDIHAKDKHGYTAAIMAKRRKHRKVYDLIISKG